MPRGLPFHSFAAARQYSTVSRMGPLSTMRPLQQVGNVGLSLAQQRTIFGVPSHNTLARLEQSANNNPSSAVAQHAFYLALLRAKMPQIVVDRYQTGQFASNTMVDSIYQQALEKVGQSGAPTYPEVANSNGSLNPYQAQSVAQAVAARAAGAPMARATSGSGFKSDPLHVVVEESRMSAITKWIKFLLKFCFCAYLVLLALSLALDTKGGSGGMRGLMGGPMGGLVKDAEISAEKQTTRFSDVHGCDEAKEELLDIVDFLKNPDRYTKLGGRLPKGVLLMGPPGTGKTLLARAVAGEAGVPFFYMSGSEFDEMFVGLGAKRVRELFAAANAKAPAIVFIDEIDAVGGKRKAEMRGHDRQTLNQLLQELDGFSQSAGLIFIGATNHPELLDQALTRPGRFDRHVRIDLPDVKGRLAILRHHTKKLRLSPDIDLTQIARGTPNFSGADIENLANSAAIQASKQQSKVVKLDHLEWAKDKIMMGSERKSRVVPLADRIHTAYHEAGHTLVGLYTKGYSELHKATILARGNAAGITFFLPKSDSQHKLKSQYYVDLEVCMGGRMAEEIVYGPDFVGSGAASDIQNATKTAHYMVTQYGFSEKLGCVDLNSDYDHVSPETRRLIDDEVRKLIDNASESSRRLLLSKRRELDLLAKGLVQYETLDKDEVMKIIKGEALPDRMIASPDDEIKIPTFPGAKDVTTIPPPTGGSGDSRAASAPGVPA